MHLLEFTDRFENKLTFSRSHRDQEAFKDVILSESERVYFGDPDDDVRRRALLEFFDKHEAHFSILDVNHYDMEAVGVSNWATQLNKALATVQCTMLYADH